MKLNTLCLVLLFLLPCSVCCAQDNSDKLVYLEKIEKYRKMKNGGATLTIVGGVLAVAGVGIMANSMDIFAAEQSDKYKTGETLFVIGAIALAPGIPLWIVGVHNHRKYSRNLEPLSVHLNVNSQNKGLTLRYRF